MSKNPQPTQRPCDCTVHCGDDRRDIEAGIAIPCDAYRRQQQEALAAEARAARLADLIAQGSHKADIDLLDALEELHATKAQLTECTAAKDGAYLERVEPVQSRAEHEIVEQTEALAAKLMCWAHGREAMVPIQFRNSTDPRARSCWDMACAAQELLTNTDPENAAAEVDDAPAALVPPSPQQAKPEQSSADSACRRQVWWTHNKAKFTTPKQAAYAGWDAACSIKGAA